MVHGRVSVSMLLVGENGNRVGRTEQFFPSANIRATLNKEVTIEVCEQNASCSASRQKIYLLSEINDEGSSGSSDLKLPKKNEETNKNVFSKTHHRK